MQSITYLLFLKFNNYIKILKKINRGHTVEQSIKAIKLLKDNCFKIDIHLMPMLPDATPEDDKKMLNDILNKSDF